jgi:hypothetical protein
MPIECSVAVCSTGQERFHFVDTRVMGHVFDTSMDKHESAHDNPQDAISRQERMMPFSE